MCGSRTCSRISEVGLGEVSEQSADLEGRGEPALFHYDAR